jgi:hypothetical protein
MDDRRFWINCGIAGEHGGTVNRIAFALGALAFSAVLSMVIVKLATGAPGSGYGGRRQ